MGPTASPTRPLLHTLQVAALQHPSELSQLAAALLLEAAVEGGSDAEREQLVKCAAAWAGLPGG